MIVIEDIDHLGLTVSDLERSIKFYQDLFDFEIVDQYSTTDHAFLKVGEILIGLYEVDGYRNVPDTKNHISFYIDEVDFDDAVEELKENDIEIVFGPENLRNGKSVIFLDPDGNQVELCYPRLSF